LTGFLNLLTVVQESVRDHLFRECERVLDIRVVGRRGAGLITAATAVVDARAAGTGGTSGTGMMGRTFRGGLATLAALAALATLATATTVMCRASTSSTRSNGMSYGLNRYSARLV